MPDTAAWIDAVRHSHERFAALVRPLSAEAVEQPSYATEWSIAQTASHLGSQGEIFGLFLQSGLNGTPAPGADVFGPIWDRWNAASPTDQVAESLRVNEAFVARLAQTTAKERAAFSLSWFGTEMDLAGLAGLRLGEHALHTWDIAVALDPTATVAAEAVELLVDQLPQTAARVGKPTEAVEPVPITTTSPDRSFLLTVSPAVTLEPSEPRPDALMIPAEALIRLVYGRLDPVGGRSGSKDPTPDGVTDERLTALRQVFPGF